MPVLKLGDSLPALPAEPKVNTTTEVKAEDLQTVRFSIQPELLPTEWMAARKDPAKYVQQLLPERAKCDAILGRRYTLTTNPC